jgi:chemotaxis protein methyltransferase CheR
MAGVSKARRARFFRSTDDKWQVRPEIQALVTFRRHDLLKDPCERAFDLIVCRNVVIYFTEGAKADLYRRFCEALRPEGILFLGATESILNFKAVGLASAGMTFYRRP